MERDLAATEERRATTQQQSIAKTVAALDSEGRAARRQLEEHVKLRREIEDSTTAYDKFAASVRRGEVSGAQARVGLAQHAQVLSTRARQATSTFGAGSPDALFAGTRETEARDMIRSIGRDAERATPQVGGLMGALRSLFSIDPERARSIDTMLEGIENKLAAASYNAVHFAGTLRALIYVGVLVFFGQLVSGVIALAGAFTAVASTAIQAGGALGGALAAGAAQALPVVGLLAAAWGRVGAVFKAVQQNIKQHLQATKESSDAANRQRDAANRVADAQERVRDSQRSLVDANQRYTDSQENLNRALKEGQRQWEDIVAAERSAELQAERSVLSQSSAQEALAQAVRSGDASSVADLSLRVREANEAVGSAQTNLQRSRQDAAEARRTGPGGLPSVVAARRQVSDAREGVGDAGRNVQKAREDLKGARQDAEDAVKKLSAADQTLQNMLADLSPAERRLYEVLNRVVKRYREVFTGPGGVLESIIDSFTFGAGRVLDLLNDDRLIGAARRLAKSISTELRRIFSFLTNTDQRSFIIEMADQARRNLPTITTFAEQVVKIFEALARAGSPAL
jgi:hypothetical protein